MDEQESAVHRSRTIGWWNIDTNVRIRYPNSRSKAAVLEKEIVAVSGRIAVCPILGVRIAIL